MGFKYPKFPEDFILLKALEKQLLIMSYQTINTSHILLLVECSTCTENSYCPKKLAKNVVSLMYSNFYTFALIVIMKHMMIILL